MEIKEPEYSVVAHVVLGAYNTIARGRRYEGGVPLTISPLEIQAYLSLNELPIELDVFMECIYMLDNDFIDKAQSRMNNQSTHKK